MSGSQVFGTWIAAFLTLCLFSFLYKDNRFFRFAEALFAGVSLGYYIGLTLVQTLKPNLIQPLFGDFAQNWHLVFAGLIGVLLYTRYIPKIAWMARSALAVYVGYFVGINMVQKLQGEVLPQSAATMVNLAGASGNGGQGAFNAILGFVGVLAVLLYFFFSLEHKGTVGKISRVGIWFLMLGFGAAFGTTVMGRISLLIGRTDFLINTWIRGTILGIGG